MNIQRGFERHPKQSPTNRQSGLRFGKVIASDPEAKTVDVTMLSGSGTYHNVPVLCEFVSTSSGKSYLPDPHNPKDEDESGYSAAVGYDKRDVYAVIGYVENNGKFPVVLGFKQPEVSQLSFSDSAGKNHKLERHESDRYSRILGDTVSENGGEDVSGEEELRFPDHSYFKVVPTGGSRDLADLSQLTRDSDEIPFQLKREGGKEFFFQHSSGTRVLIGRDGEFKISHQAGTWVSIGPDTGDLPLAAACGRTIDSKNDPPAEPDCSAVQVHIGHSSGTSVTIDAGGNITAKSTGSVHVNSSDITLGAGTAYKLLDERSHTYLGSLVASLNTWLNNHTHGENDAGGSTDTPDQTAALSSPPDIKEAATSHTVAS